MKTLLLLLLFFTGLVGFGQGEVSIEVRTNINHFTCECEAEDFVLHKNANGKKAIKFPLADFDCPKRKIERDLMELFEAKDYPFIELVVDNVEKEKGHIKAKISLAIREEKKEYLLNLTEDTIEGESFLTGQQHILLSDFELDPPVKMLGLVKVKDEFTIRFYMPKYAVM